MGEALKRLRFPAKFSGQGILRNAADVYVRSAQDDALLYVVVGVDNSGNLRPLVDTATGRVGTITRQEASFARDLQTDLVGNASSVAPGLVTETWRVTRLVYNVAAAAGATTMLAAASASGNLGPTVVAVASRSFDLLAAGGGPVVINGAETISVTGGAAADNWTADFVRVVATNVGVVPG